MHERNETKKMKVRFNILDVAIFLLVVSLLVGVAYKSGVASKVSSAVTTTEVEYVAVVYQAKDSLAYSLGRGEKVYDTTANIEVGEVSRVSSAPAVTELQKTDGTTILTPIAGQKQITIHIKAEAKLLDDGYYIGGTRHIAPGSKFHLGGSNFASEVVVIDIEETGNNTAS